MRHQQEEVLWEILQLWSSQYRCSECKKARKNREVNLIDNDEGPNIDLYVVVSEVNLVGSNLRQWWIDTGSINMFASTKSYSITWRNQKWKKVIKKNSTTLDIKGKVILKMIFKKGLTLNNIFYFSRNKKKIVSILLLSKHGFTLYLN